MKARILTLLIAVTLSAALVVPVQLNAQQRAQNYTVTDLGTLTGGTYSLAGGLSNTGWVEGYSILSNGSSHAVLWRNGAITDLGTLGGPNSDAGWRPADSGDAAGGAENGTQDPYAENFCGYGTNLICLPFLAEQH